MDTRFIQKISWPFSPRKLLRFFEHSTLDCIIVDILYLELNTHVFLHKTGPGHWHRELKCIFVSLPADTKRLRQGCLQKLNKLFNIRKSLAWVTAILVDSQTPSQMVCLSSLLPTPLPNVTPLLFLRSNSKIVYFFERFLFENHKTDETGESKEFWKWKLWLSKLISYFQLALDAQRVVGFRSAISTRAQSHGDLTATTTPENDDLIWLDKRRKIIMLHVRHALT